MRLVKTGVTRWVWLVGRWAIKFPSPYDYRHFLQGLLGNEQESYWYKELGWTGKLCPVIFSFPFYLFIIMPRAQQLTDKELRESTLFNESSGFSFDLFLRIDPNEESVFPAEKKADSFGWLNGKLVIIDYGS